MSERGKTQLGIFTLKKNKTFISVSGVDVVHTRMQRRDAAKGCTVGAETYFEDGFILSMEIMFLLFNSFSEKGKQSNQMREI